MPESIRSQLGLATERLRTVSDSPRLDAELLLARSLEWPRSRLYARSEERLSDPARQRFLELLAARECGQPVAYLLGTQEFWSLDLELGQNCLVPRPETEGLVELALAESGDALSVLDLGTGSGAIAIAIAHERPHWRVSAVDMSTSALQWAQRNGERHGVTVRWLQGSWFEPVAGECFDTILSNPPYLAADDPHLARLQHEPVQALVSGPTGLEALDHIIKMAPEHLLPDGLLALEHGLEQGPAVRDLLQSAGLTAVVTHRDLAGHERISFGRRA